MIIIQSLYFKILSYYLTDQLDPPEQGGIIGMKSGVICEYAHDIKLAGVYEVSYVPDTRSLNKIIEEWYKNGIDFAGIIHSHPDGKESLSIGDMNYAKLLFDCNSELDFAYFPIVCRNRIIPFKIVKIDNKLECFVEDVIIIEEID